MIEGGDGGAGGGDQPPWVVAVAANAQVVQRVASVRQRNNNQSGSHQGSRSRSRD